MKVTKVEPIIDENTPKKVNNSLGWTVPSVLKLLKEGNLYFMQLRDKTAQNVFRINVGVEAYALCDSISARTVFEYDKIAKEDGFGRLKVNRNLTGNVLPSIFSNGEQHQRFRKFLMDVFVSISKDYLIKVTSEMIEKHFSLWEKRYNGTGIAKPWERDILDLCSDIIQHTIIGVDLGSENSFNWLLGILKKKRSALGVKTKFFTNAIAAYTAIINGIKDSPNYQSILKLAQRRSVNEAEAVNNVIFAILFNYYGGCSATFRTCAARMSILDDNSKQTLITDIQSAIDRNGGLCKQALLEMKKVESFVLENLRMSPPVNLIFGRATENLNVKANTGVYEIKKGKLLVANLFWAHRDTQIFDDPLTFQMLRFHDNPDLKKYLYWEAGPFSQDLCSNSHQCPGRNIAIPSIMLFCIYLLMQGDYRLDKEPVWTGRKIRRLGTPDDIITLKQFKYKQENKVPLHQNALNSKLKYDEMASGEPLRQCPVNHQV